MLPMGAQLFPVNCKILSEPIGGLRAAWYQPNIPCSGGRHGRKLSLWFGPRLPYLGSQKASISEEYKRQR